MTDVVATPPAVVTAKIDDFITAYTKKATLKDGIIVLAHSGDAVTLSLAKPYTKATFKLRQTERKNLTYGGAFRLKSGTEVKTDIPHSDNLYTLDASNPSKTITNDSEKTVKEGEDTVFYDFNYYITLESAFVPSVNVDGTPGPDVAADVAVVTPPEPPADSPSEFPWWIVGVGVTIAVIAVIVIYLWTRGRPPAMPSPGVAAAPAPTPSIMVVK